jgi:hypothetical protein
LKIKEKEITMFSYKLFVIFSSPTKKLLMDQPERCCAPKQFSTKISQSIESILPNGQGYRHHMPFALF